MQDLKIIGFNIKNSNEMN